LRARLLRKRDRAREQAEKHARRFSVRDAYKQKTQAALLPPE